MTLLAVLAIENFAEAGGHYSKIADDVNNLVKNGVDKNIPILVSHWFPTLVEGCGHREEISKRGHSDFKYWVLLIDETCYSKWRMGTKYHSYFGYSRGGMDVTVTYTSKSAYVAFNPRT